MKKIFFSMIAAAGLLLASCGINTEPKTAEDCAEAFIDAYKNFDSEAMSKLKAGWEELDKDNQEEILEAAKEIKVTSDEKKEIKEKTKDLKVTKVEENGDYATATIKLGDAETTMRMRKCKDNVWRITNISSLFIFIDLY